MKPDLESYDRIIVYFSGGKDSIASLLHLLDLGADPQKIELWHHDIDGREGSSLMDWKITPGYCRAFAEAFNLPIFFSWKVGGFEGEMLRENSRTAPTRFETPEGEVLQIGGNRGKMSTRRKYPQVSADLKVRWCSAYLKIDIGAAAIRNQDRFKHSRTLTVSGERAEESPARSKYKEFEPDRSDNRNGKTGRHVDRWRPVHSWSESEVWEIIERYKVDPHPAYKMGWGRLSCMFCIFGNCNQWASGKEVDPDRFEKNANYEEEFGVTIHRTKSIREQASNGKPYPGITEDLIELSNSEIYNRPIFAEEWKLPSGAFGESAGPT